jgi:beta-phosphoglucomutase
MIKAVIFDFDGVIVDTEHLHYEAINTVLSQYGHSIGEKEISENVGLTSRQVYTKLKEKLNLPEDVDTLVMKKREIYLVLAAKKAELMPNVAEFIQYLKANNFRVAIASSGFRVQIHTILDKYGLRGHFETIVSIDDVKNPKPHPEIYLEAIKRLGLKSSECIAIEDSDKGIASAKQAGIKVIAVPNEITKNQDLSQADLVLRSLKDATLETIKNMR